MQYRRAVFVAQQHVYSKHAGVAQLVERQLPKLNVAGSSPVSRSGRMGAILMLWGWRFVLSEEGL